MKFVGFITLSLIFAYGITYFNAETLERRAELINYASLRVGIRCTPQIEQYHEKIDDAD